MALKISLSFKHGKVVMKSGNFYKFKYQGFAHDPEPHILFLNHISGIHPNTGHEHHYIQGINLTYCPRADRQKFVDDWVANYSKTKDLKFTWKLIQRKYPYISFAIRRYFWKPPYYISKLEHLDTIEKIQSTIVGNWAKDFSKKVKMKMAQFFKRL